MAAAWSFATARRSGSCPRWPREVGADEVHFSADVGPFARRRERGRGPRARLRARCCHPGLNVVDDLDRAAHPGGQAVHGLLPLPPHLARAAAARACSARRARCPRCPPACAGAAPVARVARARAGGRGPAARAARARRASGSAASCATACASYADNHDALGRDKTSRLSPYLHFGCLSPREVEERLPRRRRAPTRSGASSAGATSTITCCCTSRATRARSSRSATAARSAGATPSSASRPGARAAPAIRWSTPACASCAREGWMHNRARLVVGSFLTKDLGIDWRWGERWFMRLLIDGDEANNNGNWQWIASVGVDPQPFFRRIYNPARHMERYDPERRLRAPLRARAARRAGRLPGRAVDDAGGGPARVRLRDRRGLPGADRRPRARRAGRPSPATAADAQRGERPRPRYGRSMATQAPPGCRPGPPTWRSSPSWPPGPRRPAASGSRLRAGSRSRGWPSAAGPARLRRQHRRDARDGRDHRPGALRHPAHPGGHRAAPRAPRGPRLARRAADPRLRGDPAAAQHGRPPRSSSGSITGGLDAYAGTYDALGRRSGSRSARADALAADRGRPAGLGGLREHRAGARLPARAGELGPSSRRSTPRQPAAHGSRPRATAPAGRAGAPLRPARRRRSPRRSPSRCCSPARPGRCWRAVALWLALAWAPRAADREPLPTGLLFAAILAGGACCSRSAAASASTSRCGAPPGPRCSCWWPPGCARAAGADGLREVSRRALGRLRRVPAMPEAAQVLDGIASEGRLAAAGRTLAAELGAVPMRPLPCSTPCSAGWCARRRAFRPRAGRRAALTLRCGPARLGARAAGGRRRRACAGAGRRLAGRARRDQQVVEERRPAAAARAASGPAPGAPGSRGRRTRATAHGTSSGSAVASSVRLAQPNRPAASSSPPHAHVLEAGRARRARASSAGRERVHVDHLLEPVLLAGPPSPLPLRARRRRPSARATAAPRASAPRLGTPARRSP